MLLLGIDIGTTLCKAGVFSTTGISVSMASTKTPVCGERSGEYSCDPEELWETVIRVIRQAIGRVDSVQEIKAVGIASMAEGGTLIDRAGKALCPIIPYFDQRSTDQCRLLEQRLGRDRLFEITGLHLHPVFSLPKIMWIRDHQAGEFARAFRWLCIPDYINFRLTGRAATDYSIASRTMALDLSRSAWSEEILGAADISPELFPEILAGGTLLGAITAEASELTGLAAGTEVAMGGHDHYCGSVTAGLVHGGRVVNSLGTAESIHTLLEGSFRPSPDLKSFQFGKYLSAEYTYVDAGLLSSGLVVDWSARRFASLQDWEDIENPRSVSHSDIVEKLKGMSFDGEPLVFLPHLRGGGYPEWDPDSRGALIGLRPSHTAPHIFKAIVEGLCFETRKVLDAMTRLIGRSVEKIIAIGGGTRNEFWMQTKADVTGLTVEVPGIEESTLFGAALLAGIGVAVYSDFKNASDATYSARCTYAPRSSYRDYYERLFTQYAQILSRNLSSINRGLGNLETK
jgi:xylulokinase